MGQYKPEKPYTKSYSLSTWLSTWPKNIFWPRLWAPSWWAFWAAKSFVRARNNPGNLHTYDPEIDRLHSDDSDIANFDLSNSGSSSYYDFAIGISLFSMDNMAINDRTLKEWATPDIMYQPWCIQYPKWEQAQSYEHKSGLTHLLLEFHGLIPTTTSIQTTTIHAACTTEFLRGVGQADGHE
ncbi:hypothetical protein CR513_47037, partial [Mucuna pruriens]